VADAAEATKPDWRRAVDDRLIARCNGHVRAGERMRREPALPTWLRVPRLHLEPADWRTGFLQVREREIPWQLNEDLRQRVPQALLRDLHRPVMELGWIDRQPLVAIDRAGIQGLADARAARQRPELPRLEPATRVVRAYQTFRRGLLAEKWEPLLADDEPRRPVNL
jgi:hypothetical protein